MCASSNRSCTRIACASTRMCVGHPLSNTSTPRYAEEHRVWSHHFKTAEARLAAQAEQAQHQQQHDHPTTATLVHTEDSLEELSTTLDEEQALRDISAQAEAVNRTRMRLAALHARNAELTDLKRRLQTAQLAQERALLQQHKVQTLRAHAAEERALEERLLQQDAAVWLPQCVSMHCCTSVQMSGSRARGPGPSAAG